MLARLQPRQYNSRKAVKYFIRAVLIAIRYIVLFIKLTHNNVINNGDDNCAVARKT